MLHTKMLKHFFRLKARGSAAYITTAQQEWNKGTADFVNQWNGNYVMTFQFCWKRASSGTRDPLNFPMMDIH